MQNLLALTSLSIGIFEHLKRLSIKGRSTLRRLILFIANNSLPNKQYVQLCAIPFNPKHIN